MIDSVSCRSMLNTRYLADNKCLWTGVQEYEPIQAIALISARLFETTLYLPTQEDNQSMASCLRYKLAQPVASLGEKARCRGHDIGLKGDR